MLKFMEKSAWNRLILPSFPENSTSWTAYMIGWKRVHTALPVSQERRIGDSLHQEQILLLGESDQLVQLRHVQRERLLAQDVFAF
jgi:hypothetical protein